MAPRAEADMTPPIQATLLDLPDEVIQHILYHVPPGDVLLNTRTVSKRLYSLGSQQLLWRHHCRTQFKYWDSKHRIRQKFSGDVGDVDWKSLYIYRRGIDQVVTRTLDSILESQPGRITKYKGISRFGYDAKDTLVRHCNTEDDVADVLARRFYARSVLDHIHRAEALAEWQKIRDGEDVLLERALGSFDLFVLHEKSGDFLEISDALDKLATLFREEHPGWEELSIRKIALMVVRFLRAKNLVGCASETAYRDLQNNFLSIALHDPDHPSLPLISVVIYVCLAQRLGFDARVCGVPNHVHAMVLATGSETLDGRVTERGKRPVETMYLDPFRSDDEVSEEVMHRMLASWGVASEDFPRFLMESYPTGLVVRTARNILASVQQFRAFRAQPSDPSDSSRRPTISLHSNTNPFADMENAFYAALWANFMFGRPRGMDDSTQRQMVPLILERYERLFPMDCYLIEKYVAPLYSDVDNIVHPDLHEALRVVHAADLTAKQKRARDSDATRVGIKYRVGQVFRHRRYAYEAVIAGWETECNMGAQWIAHNDVDNLSRGRKQSFYHVLVEDNSIRYVAEENLEIFKATEAPPSLLSLAGRYFKRWDSESGTFVSNIRDEYPDD